MPNHLVTAATLTEWLRRSGGIRSGAVVDIHVESEINTAISLLTFLTATYSPDVPADIPRNLIIKAPLERLPVRDHKSGEAHFYRSVAPLLGTAPLVRCVAALEEEDDSSEIMVLEDLRSTHYHPQWPLPPSITQCEAAVEALAHIHAHWWEAATLGHTVGQFHTLDSLTSMVHGIAAHLPAFMDLLGDAVSSNSRRVYERTFGGSLQPWLRISDARALTLAHGDAHTWNFLFPRSGHGPTFLIDWQLWHLDIGARDLAFLMALHWYPTRRRELEHRLLKYYHERLLSRGVANYGLDDLWLDYRRCVVRNLTIPIILWSRGMRPEAWWYRLECALAAYRDLGCDELV